MIPYYERSGITIYHGDNREVLDGLENNIVYATVTDPPYQVNLNPATCAWDKWPADWSHIHRTTAQYLVVMIAPHVAHARIPDVLRAGWDVLEVGFWVYGNGRPVKETRLKRSYDLVYFMSKETREFFTENGRGHYRAGKATNKRIGATIRRGSQLGKAFHKINAENSQIHVAKNNYHPSNVACEIESAAFGNSGYDLIFAVKRVPSTGDDRHPTEKPLALIAQQIKLVSNPGHTILDPFCGSGTTLRAAANLGRVAIGIDQDESFCEMAAKRMEEPLLDYADRVAGYQQRGFDFGGSR